MPGERGQRLVALRKYLEGVLRRFSHCLDHPTMKSRGTFLWNRSLIEFTKANRGSLYLSGIVNAVPVNGEAESGARPLGDTVVLVLGLSHGHEPLAMVGA